MAGPPGAACRPLLALVGPTASGKTEASIAVAEALGAEIVNLDSTNVYRGMDVQTAKPGPAERARVPHHLIDVVEPEHRFSVAEFQSMARLAVAGIESRGRVPLLVGGSGLYYRAVVDGLEFPPTDPAVRRLLEAEAGAIGPERLHARLAELDPAAAAGIEPSNPRRTVRALEVAAVTGRPFSSYAGAWEDYPPDAVRAAGIEVPREVLVERIERRAAAFMPGLLAETRALLARGAGPFLTSIQAIGYAEAVEVLQGRLEPDEALRRIVRRNKALARRQMAWFRRDPRIRWFRAGPEGGVALVEEIVAHLATGPGPRPRRPPAGSEPAALARAVRAGDDRPRVRIGGGHPRVRIGGGDGRPYTALRAAEGPADRLRLRLRGGTVRLSKYHGAGNDFLLLEDLQDRVALPASTVAALCDRHTGIGADGLIRIVRPPGGPADFFMDHSNSDGSPSEMCGNGIRCLARYVAERGLHTGAEVDVDTRSGIKHLALSGAAGADGITVDMGPPRFAPGDDGEGPPRWSEADVDGRPCRATFVSMGNPHWVVFLDPAVELETLDLPRLGPAVAERLGPGGGANVEFVRTDGGRLRMRVWERGAGETMACGTGACAATVAAVRAGLGAREADIGVPGGRLRVEWAASGTVLLTGPAVHVFDVEVDPALLADPGRA
jgi:tRNA dimethylallyltransferase